MSALVSVFGIPQRWRRVVPTVATVSILGLGVSLLATPALGVPQDESSGSVVDAPAVSGDEALTAPDAVSAAAIARLENRPVEVLGERTETGSVYALPDGSMASGQGSGPGCTNVAGLGGSNRAIATSITQGCEC